MSATSSVHQPCNPIRIWAIWTTWVPRWAIPDPARTAEYVGTQREGTGADPYCYCYMYCGTILPSISCQCSGGAFCNFEVPLPGKTRLRLINGFNIAIMRHIRLQPEAISGGLSCAWSKYLGYLGLHHLQATARRPVLHVMYRTRSISSDHYTPAQWLIIKTQYKY